MEHSELFALKNTLGKAKRPKIPISEWIKGNPKLKSRIIYGIRGKANNIEHLEREIKDNQ